MRLKAALIIASFMTTPLIMAGCGFTPLHTQGAQAPLTAMTLSFDGTVAEGENGDKVEFLIRQALTDRMATGRAAYNLKVKPTLLRRSVGVTSDDIASRYDLTLRVSFFLTDPVTGKNLYNDGIIASSTFGAPRDPYGFASAQDSATQRLATEASDRMILKIATFLKKAPKQTASSLNAPRDET